ncbi:MAG: peptidyl-prolyl cis-trans isomerase [Candidatus Kapaibacterium sp.]|nr:MAG: peptidyl-prolyl cis-trans isomerase [Candidatus Kapabacteria bacterium]
MKFSLFSRQRTLRHGAVVLALFVITPLFLTARNHSARTHAPKHDALKHNAPKQDGAMVLAKVGIESITYQTLEEAFRKNLNNKNARLSALSPDSLRDFLNLYINYRLKVQDAQARGIDKKPEVVLDIAQNRASLAAPYLFEKAIVSPRVDASLERRKQQFRVGLIFSKIAMPDTTRAYTRSLAMLKLLQQGADFKQLAKDSSDDEYFRNTGGEMPMVTSDRILREIENAAYTMKVGEIYPKPIRSNLSVPGYYVVKLLTMEARVTVRGRYINIKRNEQIDSATAENTAKKLADSLYAVLQKGGDFAELAKKFSNDVYAEYGGLFPSYYSPTTGYLNGLRYRFPESVDAWLMDSKRSNGELSQPISTDKGYYIVRRDSSKIGGDEREEMKRFYKRVHFENDKKIFFDSVKKARKYALSQKTFDALMKALDTTRPAFDSVQKTKLPAKLMKEELASFTGYKLTVAAFADSLLQRSDLRGFSLTKQGMMQALDKVSEAAITDALTKNMEKDFPDFAALMKEFQEGILIFRVEEQEVWSKMKFDSTKARAWYEPKKNDYRTLVMYDFSEIWTNADSTAQSLYKRLQDNMKTAKPSATLFDSLAMQFTERSGFKERKGRWDPLDARPYTIPEEFKKRASKAGDILPPFKFQGGTSIPRLNAILPERVKTFEEAIPDFAAQFQDIQQRELTQKWLESLRAKFPVSVDEAALKRVRQ